MKHKQNSSIINQSKPGWRSWLVLGLSGAFLVYKYILQISPAVMSHDLMRDFALSGTGLGLLVGFYFYTYMLMQIPAGILLDRYSVKTLTALAICLCAVGVGLFSQTHYFYIACFARLLIGFGAAFATVSYMKLASQWFPPRYFALLTGLFATACMGGAGLAETSVAWLVHHFGWRQTLFASAIAGLGLVAIFITALRDLHHTQPFTPEHTREKPGALAGLISVIKNKDNWPLMLYGGLAFTPVNVFAGLWGVPFLSEAYHLSRTQAATSVSLAFFGLAIGAPMMGYLSRYVEDRRSLLLIGTVCSLIFCSLIIYMPNLSIPLLNISIFLFGFSISTFLLSYAIGKETNPILLTATVISVINMGDAICGAIAEPLIGRILDLGWHGTMSQQVRYFTVHDYRIALSVLTAYLILAIIMIFFIKEKHYGAQALADPHIYPL